MLDQHELAVYAADVETAVTVVADGSVYSLLWQHMLSCSHSFLCTKFIHVYAFTLVC